MILQVGARLGLQFFVFQDVVASAWTWRRPIMWFTLIAATIPRRKHRLGVGGEFGFEFANPRSWRWFGSPENQDLEKGDSEIQDRPPTSVKNVELWAPYKNGRKYIGNWGYFIIFHPYKWSYKPAVSLVMGPTLFRNHHAFRFQSFNFRGGLRRGRSCTSWKLAAGSWEDWIIGTNQNLHDFWASKYWIYPPNHSLSLQWRFSLRFPSPNNVMLESWLVQICTFHARFLECTWGVKGFFFFPNLTSVA